MIAHKNATLMFFREMEANIRRKAQEPMASPRRAVSDGITTDSNGQIKNRTNSYDHHDNKINYDTMASFEQRGRLNSLGGAPPRRIRTISTMDG